MGRYRLLAPALIILAGWGIYAMSSPSTLCRETVEIDGRRFSTQMYIRGDDVCVKVDSLYSWVADASSAEGVSASIVGNKETSRIEFWLGDQCVARYDINSQVLQIQ